jgi:hypothetical protein
LHFSPDRDDIVNSFKSLLPFGGILLEFLNFLLSHHCHDKHLLSLDIFDDSFHRSKQIGIFVLNEFEILVIPSLGNIIDIRFNLAFLLSAFYDFIDFIGVLEKLQLDQVFKTELR